MEKVTNCNDSKTNFRLSTTASPLAPSLDTGLDISTVIVGLSSRGNADQQVDNPTNTQYSKYVYVQIHQEDTFNRLAHGQARGSMELY